MSRKVKLNVVVEPETIKEIEEVVELCKKGGISALMADNTTSTVVRIALKLGLAQLKKLPNEVPYHILSKD